jgi:hypothetical protein
MDWRETRMKSHLPNRSSFTVIAILLSAISTQVSAGVFFQGTGNPDQDPNLQGGTVINFDAGPPDTSGEVSFDGVTFIGDDATTVDVVETVTVGDALIGTLNTRGTYSLYNGPEASSSNYPPAKPGALFVNRSKRSD